eukprot:4435201-Prymnesium_polylepis.2
MEPPSSTPALFSSLSRWPFTDGRSGSPPRRARLRFLLARACSRCEPEGYPATRSCLYSTASTVCQSGAAPTQLRAPDSMIERTRPPSDPNLSCSPTTGRDKPHTALCDMAMCDDVG